MSTNPQPIVRMEYDANGASVINYNVPEPTAYFGNMHFELDLDKLLKRPDAINLHHNAIALTIRKPDWKKYFNDFLNLPFDGRQSAIDHIIDTPVSTQAMYIKGIVENGYSHKLLNRAKPPVDKDLMSYFIYLPKDFEGLAKIGNSIIRESKQVSLEHSIDPSATVSPLVMNILATGSPNEATFNTQRKDSLTYNRWKKFYNIDYSIIAQRIREGNFFVIYRTFGGQFDYKFVPIPAKIIPKIFIVEKYKLSSFLGNYGAGKTIKTFSLLPGEKMKISVSTFRKSSVETSLSSSILDSFSQESADDFETTLSAEQSNTTESSEKSAWHAEGDGSLDLGIASFGGGGGTSGETGSAREDISKTVSEAVAKHSQKASSQREINIETSYERREEAGEETSTEREIENINVGRALNFVFRQMNQQYLTILHLIDAKVCYTSGLPGSFNQDSISNLDNFLKNILNNQNSVQQIKEGIVDHLCKIVNYKDEHIPFIESKNFQFDIEDPTPRRIEWKYLRVKKNITDKFLDRSTGLEKEVPGIVIAGQVNVMRTEGVFVEALLGQGNALDPYSQDLQNETIREKQVVNDLKVKEAEKIALANSIVANNETEKAKLFEQVYPCCPGVICNCTNKTES